MKSKFSLFGCRFEHLLEVKWFLAMLFAIQYITLVSSLTECTRCQDCQVELAVDHCFCKVIRVENYDDALQCVNIKRDSYLNIQNQGIYQPQYLKYLFFLNSKIGHLKISLLTDKFNFQCLYWNRSGIEDIQAGALSSVTAVKELYLQENLLSRVTRGCFNSLFHLKILDLHSNRIKFIEDDSFHGLNLLENLNLADNNLTSIPLNLLTYLYNLRTFNISRNYLKTIDFQFSIPSHIKRVSRAIINEDYNADYTYDSNDMMDSDTADFEVDSDSNLINNHANEMINSDLSYNRSNEMIELDLSYNQITEIPSKLFKNMKQLRLLNISKNDISDLKISTFINLQNLNTLNMHSLKLKTLDLKEFVLLTHLEVLNIESNRLKFTRDILDFCPDLKFIAIDGNQFSCNAVASMIMNSKLRKITIKYTPNYKTGSIYGIPCIKKMEMSSEPIGNISRIIHEEIKEAFQGLLNNITSIVERNGNISELNPKMNQAIKSEKLDLADTQLNEIFNRLGEIQNFTSFEESLSNLTMIISSIKSSQDENSQKLKQIEERQPNFFNDQLLKNISRKLDATSMSRDKFFSNFLKTVNRMENNNRSVENQTISSEKLKKLDVMVSKLYSKFYTGKGNLESDTRNSISDENNTYNFETLKSVNESVFAHLKAAHKDPEENIDSVATKMDFLIVLSVICYFTMFLIVAYIIGEKKLLSKFKNRSLHEEACNEMSSLTN
ncbi:hypothetical protein WA026_003676 [Henosepilachna vigintioctopunctata]|uniref:Uncharacterized protein n=1 Tax=Henosepilachna vigintioctopunctata TaxID=420089 RepID=A0AAW1UDN9_9CUCU